jgi:hypothetical protein
MRTVAERATAWAAVIALSVASGCGGASHSERPPPGSRYAPAVQATFLRACKAGSPTSATVRARCKCALSYLEARIAQRKLQDTERAIVKGEATVPQWMRDAVAACKPE